MKNLFKMLGLLVICLSIVACVTQSPTVQETKTAPMPPKPETEITTPTLTANIPIDERVRMGSLPNGLKYYIQQNAKPHGF